LLRAARRHGYRVWWQGGDAWRLIKNPWGYWGDPLLHGGMLMVIVAALLCALTQLRGVIRLTEGEVVAAGTPLADEERGPWASSSFLAEAVRLDAVSPLFWPTDELRELRAAITFLGPHGRQSSQAVAINQPLRFRGLRFDLARTFGRSFFVTLSREGGRPLAIRLDLTRPLGRGVASYGNFSFPGVPLPMAAKYHGDGLGKRVDSDEPLLVLRLLGEERLPFEVALTPGQGGQLGPYTATLVRSARFVDCSVTDLHGVPLLFAGFMVVILGCGLIYCTPPREILLRQQQAGVALRWLAGRFSDFHGQELDDIIGDALPGGTHA
jgi:hypothetical protein